MTDVLVIGAGPAGVLAALRAADLGAQTALVTSGAFGGMAANDGPVPVRILAHAGRLMRVDDLARIPLSYPTYAGILVSVAVKAAHELGLAIGWQAHQAA
jgi:pyruvate/2-oxoglutarate dehydrogenase complex dihydrolipoamide dehydrogenase (E3) component